MGVRRLDGGGVDVCILDSGIDHDHPLIGEVASAVVVTFDDDGDPGSSRTRAGTSAGTAPPARGSCARSRRDCSFLHSVRVLRLGATGTGDLILAGLRHAIEGRVTTSST